MALDQPFSNLSLHSNHLEGLLIHRLLGPNPGESDSEGLGGGPRLKISNKFSGDADATGTRTPYQNFLQLVNLVLSGLAFA